MTKRVYLSNISPRWTIKRQELLLRAALPDYPKGVTVFHDELDRHQRQSHLSANLVQRAEMLKKTRRKAPEDIYLAGLPPLAWTTRDLLVCLSRAVSRMATIHVLEPPLLIGPDAGADVMLKAAEAFEESRKASQERRGVPGAKVSAERRIEAARAKAAAIRERWRLPIDQYPTAALLAEANISRNTAIFYLGPRRKPK